MINSADALKEMKKSDSAREAKSEQLASLNGFKRVDVLDEAAPTPKKGEEPAMRKAIRIPVEEAQRIILKELSSAPAPTPGT